MQSWGQCANSSSFSEPGAPYPSYNSILPKPYPTSLAPGTTYTAAACSPIPVMPAAQHMPREYVLHHALSSMSSEDERIQSSPILCSPEHIPDSSFFYQSYANYCHFISISQNFLPRALLSFSKANILFFFLVIRFYKGFRVSDKACGCLVCHFDPICFYIPK